MKYSSVVVKGYGRGKQIGFPTFNLLIPSSFDQKYGVYSARVEINGKIYSAALHFGPIPTFNHKYPVLEIFVLDYMDDQMVKKISFELISYLREIRQFKNQKDLAIQIAEDVERIKELSC